jgi:hypothetical protein
MVRDRGFGMVRDRGLGRFATALGERGGGALEQDARQAMQTGDLDQRPDLGLSVPEQQRASTNAKAARDHREVEHQRGVREHKLAEVDDDIGLGADRAYERLSAASLRRPILVSTAAQDRRLVIEIDDVENLPKDAPT